MNFKKIAKVTFITVGFIACTLGVSAQKAGKSFDWNPLMDAITQVESEGNARAVSGKSCGVMQITPILVQECNNILKERGEKMRYTLNDRFNVKKSREMFVLIMSEHNPDNDIERAIRMWNGGPNYTAKRTQAYYRKVMAVYNT